MNNNEIIIKIPEKVEYIINELKRNGYEAYVVGGCVRDSLSGRSPEDWDITTSARPEQVKKLFRRTIDTGIAHGTVTIMMGKEGFEVTTYRIDGEYEDSRHPKNVLFTPNLEEDLKRRDFTINAMAYNQEEGLVDIFHGKEDLEQKRICCVGNPEERFDEDALRILRAVRFAAQLGFDIEDKTRKAAKEKAEHLKNISAERIRTELSKLLVSDRPDKLCDAWKLGITKIILPEFDTMMETDQNNLHHIYSVGIHSIKAVEAVNRISQGIYTKKQRLILAYTMLLHDVGKPECKTTDENGQDHFYKHPESGANKAKEILTRLKFDNETIGTVIRLIRHHDERCRLTPEGVRKAVNRIGDDIMELLFTVKKADIQAKSPEWKEEEERELETVTSLYKEIKMKKECLTLQELAVSGNDLIQAGFCQGKHLGEVLNLLLEEVLEHPERNEKEYLLEKAGQFI